MFHTVIDYTRIDPAHRETVDKALRSLGKHDLADKLPTVTHTAADIVALIDEAATAFEDGRPLDGLTAIERALEPKWANMAESQEAYEAEVVA